MREVELKRHVFVVGATGTGKSKFLCLALSMLVRLGRIVVLVDPDGDLCDDVIAWGAAYAAKLGTDAMVRRFHIVEPNPEQMLFHHDPFLYQGSYPFGSFQYHCWLDRRVEDVARTILAYTQLGDIEFGVQKRLERWLKNYLYAAGVALDEKGTHLGMVKALVLLNPHHDHFGATLARVAPFLPPEVREDFERFEHLSNGRVDEILESTTNRLRAVLTTLVRELLSQNVQSIDFDAVVNTPGQVLLVNLQDTDYFSREQANFIGHIVIEEVLARTRSRRGERRQVYLFIDECWRYTSQTIENCLVGHRKYGLSCVLACQHVGKLKRNDLDLRPDVIENCRTIIAFAQTHPDHVELLSRVLGYGNLDFEELYQVVDRPDGYDWEEVEEESMALSRSAGWAKGRSETNTGTDSWGQSRSLTSQESWSDTDSQQQAIASSDSTTDSSGVSNGSTRSQTPLISDQEVQRMIPLAGSQSADQRGSASTASNSLTQTDGQSSTRGGSLAEGRGESLGGSRAEALGTNWQDSGNESISHTVSRKLVPLARHREEWHPTGRLRRAVDDQFYKIGHRLHQLQTRQAMVRPADGGPAVTFQVHEVPQPFATEAYRRAMIENFKSKVFAAHAYNFPAPVDYDPLDQDVEAAPSDTEQPGDNGTAGGSQDDNGNLTANRRDLPQTTSGGAGPNGKPQRPSQNGKTKSNGHTAPRVAREADPFEPK